MLQQANMRRMQLFIKHVIYAYIIYMDTLFSYRIQLTIRCTSDMCKTYKKEKKGTRCHQQQEPVTKQNKKWEGFGTINDVTVSQRQKMAKL